MKHKKRKCKFHVILSLIMTFHTNIVNYVMVVFSNSLHSYHSIHNGRIRVVHTYVMPHVMLLYSNSSHSCQVIHNCRIRPVHTHCSHVRVVYSSTLLSCKVMRVCVLFVSGQFHVSE